MTVAISNLGFLAKHFPIISNFTMVTLDNQRIIIHCNFNMELLYQYQNFLAQISESHQIIFINQKFTFNSKINHYCNLLAKELSVKSNIVIIEVGELYLRDLLSQNQKFPRALSNNFYISDQTQVLKIITSPWEDISGNYYSTISQKNMHEIQKLTHYINILLPKLDQPQKYSEIHKLDIDMFFEQEIYITDDEKNKFNSYIDHKIGQFVVSQYNQLNLNPEIYLNLPPELNMSKYYLESYFNHYFERVYVLNLASRKDRWHNMQNALAKYNVKAHRLEGINGNHEPHYSEWKEYLKKPLTKQEQKLRKKGIKYQGSWGILKSMKNLIIMAKQEKLRNLLILQDDLIFHKNFLQEFHDYTKSVGDNWKLLYLGASQHIWNTITIDIESNYYHPVGNTEGAFAVGIDSSCYDEMLAEIEKFNLPVDSGALSTLQKIHSDYCYVPFPNLIIADIRDSDIRGCRGFDNIGKLFRWDLKNYEPISN